jgi:hypothetical protein
MILPLFLFAQKYQSVIENIDSLIILTSNPEEGSSQPIIIHNDTIINNIKYHKLGFNHSNFDFFDVEECIDYYMDNLFIREDSTFSKIYIYSKECDSEYIIMDLNLNPQDTFQVNTNEKFIVDSIFYENELKIIEFKNYKEIGLFPVNVNLRFIEGIGPNWGIFYPFNDSGNLLLCCYKDKAIQYENPYDFGCNAWWVVDGVKEIDKSDIVKIKTQSQHLEINVNSEKTFDVYLYDLTGHLVLSSKNNNQIFKSFVDNMDFAILKVIIDKEVCTKKIILKNYW